MTVYEVMVQYLEPQRMIFNILADSEEKAAEAVHANMEGALGTTILSIEAKDDVPYSAADLAPNRTIN